MTSAQSKTGRPLMFATVEELETAINCYFDDCDKHEDTRVWSHDELVPEGDKQLCTNCWQQAKTKGCLLVSGHLKLPRPYTVTGLASWLDTSRQTLNNYEMRDEYFDTVRRAKQKIENYAEERLFDKEYPTRGVIFSLSNNADNWSERRSTDLNISRDGSKELGEKLFAKAAAVADTADDDAVDSSADEEATGSAE